MVVSWPLFSLKQLCRIANDSLLEFLRQLTGKSDGSEYARIRYVNACASKTLHRS